MGGRSVAGETVRTVWAGGALLGEGPVWDAGRGVLWFVDIKGQHVHRLDPATDQVASWPAPERVGWVLPAEGDVLVAGLKTGLARFDPATGSFAPLAPVEPHLPGNRLNDAAVAPDGTIWFGTMDDAEDQATGRVHRFDGRAVTTLPIAPAVVVNGPALSPDGRTLYHVDSGARTIHAFAAGEDGTLGAGRVFAEVDPADGYPDGPSVDSAGNVWVGLWQGWRARLYAPDGAILREVRLPAANVTKVALGGPDLTTAYVTTARVGLSEEELAAQPEAGHLFAFQVDTPGLAHPRARVG